MPNTTTNTTIDFSTTTTTTTTITITVTATALATAATTAAGPGSATSEVARLSVEPRGWISRNFAPNARIDQPQKPNLKKNTPTANQNS